MYFTKYCAKAFNYLWKTNSDNKITQRAINWASDMWVSTDRPSLLRKPAGLATVVVIDVVCSHFLKKVKRLFAK